MKRIKSVNGYAIYQASARDEARYNVTAGGFYLYFASDIRDYGIACSEWDWEASSLDEAIEWATGSNYAAAREIVEATTTAASFEEIEAVEKQLDSGIAPEDVTLCDEGQVYTIEENGVFWVCIEGHQETDHHGPYLTFKGAEAAARNYAAHSEGRFEYISGTRKTYTTSEGHAHQETTSAAEAMAWHRSGRRVTVWGRRADGSQYHTSIPGAAVETEREKTERENRDHCRRIALEVEEYASGKLCRCPECDSILTLPEEEGEKYRCPHCGEIHTTAWLDRLGLWDYFEDVLDIEYRIEADRKTLRSVSLLVTFGGPNIYIDTASCAVELYWWGDRASFPIDRDVCGEIDSWAEELWQC